MGDAGTGETLLIVGVGNELLGDEGLGVHVVRSLLQSQPALPDGVEVLDAGTALLDVLPEMSRRSRVVIVDAVRTGREPGTLYRAEVDPGFLEADEASIPVSLHQLDLLETLRVGKALGLLPKQLTLLGAEPETLSPGTELSPRVARAAQRIVSMLTDEMSALSQTASRPPG